MRERIVDSVPTRPTSSTRCGGIRANTSLGPGRVRANSHEVAVAGLDEHVGVAGCRQVSDQPSTEPGALLVGAGRPQRTATPRCSEAAVPAVPRSATVTMFSTIRSAAWAASTAFGPNAATVMPEACRDAARKPVAVHPLAGEERRERRRRVLANARRRRPVIVRASVRRRCSTCRGPRATGRAGGGDRRLPRSAICIGDLTVTANGPRT